MELASEKSADIHNNGNIGSHSCRNSTCNSTQSKGYTAIYTGLDSEESSQVVSAINELGITDVKMGTDGSISVPSDQADNVRMQLSIQGYPKSTFNFDVWNSGIGIWSTTPKRRYSRYSSYRRT